MLGDEFFIVMLSVVIPSVVITSVAEPKNAIKIKEFFIQFLALAAKMQFSN
jgi:hypothetical protein